MAQTDLICIETIAGTVMFRVDASGNVYAAGTLSSDGTDDFGTSGIKADVVAESTSGAGVTIDGLLIKDESIDASGSGVATGDFNLTLKANLADAWSIKDSTGDMVVFTTTTATPGIAETFARTGAGNAHSIASTWNSASATGVGLAVSASQITTVRTSGTVTGIKSTVVSLAGDTGGDYVALEIASTDGGGTTPFHSGIYTASPLDALIKVSADGMGAFVIGATMTVSPEATAESGYFRVNVGSTVYQVPIYAA